MGGQAVLRMREALNRIVDELGKCEPRLVVEMAKHGKDAHPWPDVDAAERLIRLARRCPARRGRPGPPRGRRARAGGPGGRAPGGPGGRWRAWGRRRAPGRRAA